MIQAIQEWLTTEHGFATWVVGLFVLPLLAVLLIFGARELLLKIVSRLAGDRMHRAEWRRVTRFAAILISLVAVGLIIQSHATEIAAALSPEGREGTERIVIGLVRFLGSTAILVLLLLASRRAFAAVDAWLDTWSERSGGFRLQQVTLLEPEQAARAGKLALRIARFALILFLVYLYVPVALSSHPATEPLAHRVMPFVLQPLAAMGLAIVGYIPNLIMLVLIFIVMRWALRLFKIFLSAVGEGQMTLGSFKPAWAAQTYRLVHILGIIFAVVLMYPFLPGSDSAVFKGLSVFIGAALTFGAGASVSNLVSGVMLTYNSTFEIGDRVRMGGTVGDVLELGLFFTLLQTLDNERVSVPNAVALKGEVVNISEASDLGGLKLRITVRIGYDTDWQQVEDLLNAAARRTSNVRSEPEPTVLQSSLDEYAVAYTVVVALEDPTKARDTRSHLFQNIQDAFNEAGVEIMTPAVRAVRDSLDPAVPEKYLSDPAGPTEAHR
ncbi:MAG: mechanosensitive ion channel family protein [Gemmatimonadota bacterium]